jgi:putative membrane protein
MIASRMSGKIISISVSALMASAPMFACSGPTCPCQALDRAVVEISGLEVQGAYTHTGPVNMQLLGDQEFVREALEDSVAKVLLGQLAQRKSQSEDIRQFGQKMVQEHTQLTEQIILRVAKLIGVPESKALSRKDKQLTTSLEALSGAQFDEAYIKAMVKDHKQDLKRFSSEQDVTQDPGVKITAEQGTNLISKHLELIEQIAERHNVVAKNSGAAIGE